MTREHGKGQVAALRSDLQRATAAQRRYNNAHAIGGAAAALGELIVADHFQSNITSSGHKSTAAVAAKAVSGAASSPGGLSSAGGGAAADGVEEERQQHVHRSCCPQLCCGRSCRRGVDPEALARERVESRIRIVELEAEAYEAHAARAAAEGALRSAIEQRESGVAEAEAVALEEARQFVQAEAASFDERLSNAQAMFDTTKAELTASGEASAAAAAEAGMRSHSNA